MDELKVEDVNDDKELSLTDKVNTLYSLIETGDRKKIKNLKLPRKAKISKSKMKKGWVGVLFQNGNRIISGEKVQLEGGTYRTKDKNYHITDGSELIFWEGKFPILWQRHNKLNPSNLFSNDKNIDEVYGQDQIMLRMKKDLISEKPKGGMSLLYLGGILVGGYFLLKMFFPHLFGG